LKKIDGRAGESLRTFRILGASHRPAPALTGVAKAILAVLAIIGFATLAFSETDQTETLDYHIQN